MLPVGAPIVPAPPAAGLPVLTWRAVPCDAAVAAGERSQGMIHLSMSYKSFADDEGNDSGYREAQVGRFRMTPAFEFELSVNAADSCVKVK